MNHPLTDSKKQLRKQIQERIRRLDPAYTAKADAQIVGHLLSLPEYRRAKTVFCFVGTDHEINTLPFLRQVLDDGKTLCVPLCVGKRTMEARQITSLCQLRTGSYGIAEPDPDTCPVVDPHSIDLAVIPCVTCSHTGDRLGHGGGYYDVFFSLCPDIPSAMICREAVICGSIPREAHDLAFPLVITEEGVYRDK